MREARLAGLSPQILLLLLLSPALVVFIDPDAACLLAVSLSLRICDRCKLEGREGRRKSERHERQEEPLHGGSPYVMLENKSIGQNGVGKTNVPVRFRANQRPLNQKEAALSGGLAGDLWRGPRSGL